MHFLVPCIALRFAPLVATGASWLALHAAVAPMPVDSAVTAHVGPAIDPIMDSLAGSSAGSSCGALRGRWMPLERSGRVVAAPPLDAVAPPPTPLMSVTAFAEAWTDATALPSRVHPDWTGFEIALGFPPRPRQAVDAGPAAMAGTFLGVAAVAVAASIGAALGAVIRRRSRNDIPGLRTGTAGVRGRPHPAAHEANQNPEEEKTR